MKSVFKDIVKVVMLIGSILLGGFLIYIVYNIFIILYTIGGIEDHLTYKDSLKTKEDVFRMIYDNQEEYEKLVSDMADILEESGVDFILLEKIEDYKAYGIESSLLKDYPIIYISPERHKNGYLEVDFSLTFTPPLYNYWGVYYSESGNALDWGAGGELIEENGIFTQRGSYFIYETEKIKDNWYYYQCRT